jgi:hypothetical protein
MTRDQAQITQIDIRRFQKILESYGASEDRWPVAERDAAQALVRNSPEARKLRDDAIELDRVLDLADSPEPSPALATRIVSAARQTPGWGERLSTIAAEIWPFGRQWQAAAIFASAAILGLALGAVPLPPMAGQDELPIVEELALLTFGPELTTEDQD